MKAFEKTRSLLHKSLQLAALQNSFRIFTDQVTGKG
jgi:vacuolar-type H+-ATPase subunit D/Vma8